MLDTKNLVALTKAVSKADKNNASNAYSFNGSNYTYEALNETLRNELNALIGTNALWRENKNKFFSIIEETIDDVIPAKVSDIYAMFAETKTFKQGDKPLFRRKVNTKNRAKQFVTRVGLAGVYEVFKLSNAYESFEVPTSAIGAAAQIGFEEFLDGRVDFSELIDVIMTGMDELIYLEITKALAAGIDQLPANNVALVNGFDEDTFDRLLKIAAQYGPFQIYCSDAFAVKMIPKEAWRWTEDMKNELWQKGRLTGYKGHTVVILPQGLEDETNTRYKINPSYCYIIPTGGDSRPVKIAIEGGTQSREVENYDWSREIQVYLKIGVAPMFTNDICIYQDTSLADDDDLLVDKYVVNGYKDVDTTVAVKLAEDTAVTIEPAEDAEFSIQAADGIKVYNNEEDKSALVTKEATTE